MIWAAERKNRAEVQWRMDSTAVTGHEGVANFSTLFIHWYTVVISSWETMSTNLIHGPFSLEICFLTMASKAMSGVKRPLLHTDRETQITLFSHSISHCREKIHLTFSQLLKRTLYYTWCRECSWWHSWSPASASSRSPPSEDKHLTVSAHGSFSEHLSQKRDAMVLSIMQFCRDKSVWM